MSSSSANDNLHWRVWETANRLELDGISIGDNSQLSKAYKKRVDQVTQQVVSILRQWGNRWAIQGKLASLLNKKTLKQEIEECIIALAFLTEWLDQRTLDNAKSNNKLLPITIVDVCAGKGIFSMLTSYILQSPLQEKKDDCQHHQPPAQDEDKTNNKDDFNKKSSTYISKIIMLDKAKIDWGHIHAANEDASEEGRPMIEVWSGCNLHETDKILDRLRSKDVQDNESNDALLPSTMSTSELVLVGIHLCKSLSPTFIGIVNSLGSKHCPFFCLAPCCLPSAVYYHDKRKQHEQKNNGRKRTKTKKNGGIIEILQYETPQERKDRMNVLQKRKNVKSNRVIPACILCASTDHGVHNCTLLPSDKEEQIKIFHKAASSTPCWRCGVVGHFKDDCPSKQTSCVPTLVRPPIVELNVSKLIENTRTNDVNMEKNNTKKGDLFLNYCGLLSSTIQMKEQVEILEAGLTSHRCSSIDDSSNINNQNAHRKSIFIVAK